jgi:hypothetical protein
MRNFMIFISFIVISVIVLTGEYVAITTLGTESFINIKTAADILYLCQSISYKVAGMNFVMTFIYWVLASRLLKSNLNLL